ncbi:protein of unknown function [Anoxynatronum buryatiense]|uniref:DUF3870 domain-containing protein n=2 Tax=Anoxynatronum buryatiense TaxID=489973 RepID=A0AA45WV47_9CLOT|nr:protein of unknown function [Anoxynatronum buryatiense]
MKTFSSIEISCKDVYNSKQESFEYFATVVKQMSSYPQETVYFISYAKLPGEIPAATMHRVVGIGLIIHQETGEILDVSCTLLTREAREFLKSVLQGHNVHEEESEAIVELIRSRYHGLAQKAVCVAVKGSIERYFQWKNSGQSTEPVLNDKES